MPYTCTKISWEIPIDLVHVSVGPTCHFSQVGEPIITQESPTVWRSTQSGGRTLQALDGNICLKNFTVSQI